MFKKWYFGKLNKKTIALEAEELLRNDAFIIAKEAVQNDILERWGSTSLEDTNTREKLFMQYKAVEDVSFELSRLVTSREQSLDTNSDQGEINDGY